jgi:hypothetical protein
MIIRPASQYALVACLFASLFASSAASADEKPAAESAPAGELRRAFINGDGPGWRTLGEADFENVNCDPDTWSFKDGMIFCTGTPVGVMRTKKQVKNFELVAEWRHRKSGGNSGIFVWSPPEAHQDLPPNKLPPGGIEVQILDHGYAETWKAAWEKKNPGKPLGEAFFSTNGDVFPVGKSKMTPFAPTSPNGARSFPRKNLSLGIDQWNHYYVRGINGEVRLWVNGEEVSGGTGCTPAEGHLCLESEGAPVEFKNIRIRELP